MVRLAIRHEESSTIEAKNKSRRLFFDPNGFDKPLLLLRPFFEDKKAYIDFLIEGLRVHDCFHSSNCMRPLFQATTLLWNRLSCEREATGGSVGLPCTQATVFMGYFAIFYHFTFYFPAKDNGLH